TDGMTALVTRCTRDLRYEWVSRSYAEWLHRKPDEIVGRPIAEIVGREAFEELLPEFSQVLEGVPVRSEKEVVFAGLGPRWIQAPSTPTLDPSGVADGWVAVVHDIDELRRAEEALKELDRRKDDFLALLGHELRNPLAPIHNAVDLLERVGS